MQTLLLSSENYASAHHLLNHEKVIHIQNQYLNKGIEQTAFYSEQKQEYSLWLGSHCCGSACTAHTFPCPKRVALLQRCGDAAVFKKEKLNQASHTHANFSASNSNDRQARAALNGLKKGPMRLWVRLRCKFRLKFGPKSHLNRCTGTHRTQARICSCRCVNPA